MLKAIEEPNPYRQPPLNPTTYVSKFNETVQKNMQEEYRSKNEQLFTWNHTIHHQNKLKLPPSLQKTVSENLSLKEEASRVNPEMSLTNNSPQNQTVNAKVLEDVVEPNETSKLGKKSKKEKYLSFFATVGDFGNIQKVNPFIKPKPVSPNKDNKSYSIAKLQTDLLTNQTSPVLENIPNKQYMTNQFDRRNFTVNRIISQIKAQDDLLDKEEIKDETVKKLKYVLRNTKVNRSRPRTDSYSNGITRTHTLGSPKSLKPTDIEVMFGSSSMKSISEKGLSKQPQEKRQTVVKNVRQRTFKNLETDLLDNQIEVNSSIKSKNKENGKYKIRDKADLKQMMPRAKKPQEVEKFDYREFYFNVNTGLKDLEIAKAKSADRESPYYPDEDLRSGFLVRINSTNEPFRKGISKEETLRRAISVFGDTSNEEMKKSVMSPKSPKKLSNLEEDNIFHFKRYFKNKYLEKDSEFAISKDLKQKIKSFGKELGDAARSIQQFSLKDKKIMENSNEKPKKTQTFLF